MDCPLTLPELAFRARGVEAESIQSEGSAAAVEAVPALIADPDLSLAFKLRCMKNMF